jgi:DNA-binding XRE family transcriptional regulator
MARNKSWDEIRGELALTDEDVAAYARLDEAERRLYEARRRRGITDAEMAQALGVDEERTWSVDHDDDLYLFALARYVAAAGGRLELRAVFPDEAIVLLTEPEAEPSPERR